MKPSLGIGKEKILLVAYAVVVAAGVLFTRHRAVTAEATEVFAMPANKKIVVIDAGHGGWDPGMIGLSGTIEKDINLKIAEKLQSYLEIAGAIALVTRADDDALADSKRADLRSRQELADSADILISIHQNQYVSESVKGAIVFYFGDSSESKRLAECIQKQVAAYLDPSNRKLPKANSGYYLLKKTTVPSVIVECGFLSNAQEEKLLSSDSYQEKVAWTIYIGALNYFSGEGKD